MAEKILRGEKKVIWKTLSAIRELYPQTNECNAIPLHLLNIGIKKSNNEIISLEQSIINWLQALHLARDGEATLIDMEDKIRSGVLLCELANVLHRYTSKVHGLIYQPKNQAAALSNIKKAFVLFRELPLKNKKYLWSEKEVLKGDRGTILGLLEQLYKYYEILNKKEKKSQYLSTHKCNKSISPLFRTNITSKDYNEGQGYDIPSVSTPVPYPYPSNPTQLKRNTRPINEFNEAFINRPKTAVLSPKNLSNESEGRKLLIWIRQLGFNLSQDSLFSAENMKLLTNGVLLSQIVSKLERKTIEGINEYPKSTASSLHNIRKVLNTLKGKKRIPVGYLYSDVEIQDGDKEVILGVLTAIKAAYPNTIRRR